MVSTLIILNDLEPPKWCFRVFFAIFDCGPHFKSELRRNGWRLTWTAGLRMKFLA